MKRVLVIFLLCFVLVASSAHAGLWEDFTDFFGGEDQVGDIGHENLLDQYGEGGFALFNYDAMGGGNVSIVSKTQCKSSNPILMFSDNVDAHVQIPSYGYHLDFNYALCYNYWTAQAKILPYSCVQDQHGVEPIIKLASAAGPHAADPNSIDYGSEACHYALDECELVSNDLDCPLAKGCVLELSAETNAHVAACGYGYDYKVCCGGQEFDSKKTSFSDIPICDPNDPDSCSGAFRCVENSQSPTGGVCIPDGELIGDDVVVGPGEACGEDIFGFPNVVCRDGTCPPSGICPDGDGGIDDPCVTTADCDGNLICDTVTDTCQDPDEGECLIDSDCEDNEICDAGDCKLLDEMSCEEGYKYDAELKKCVRHDGDGGLKDDCEDAGDCEDLLQCFDVNGDGNLKCVECVGVAIGCDGDEVCENGQCVSDEGPGNQLCSVLAKDAGDLPYAICGPGEVCAPTYVGSESTNGFDLGSSQYGCCYDESVTSDAEGLCSRSYLNSEGEYCTVTRATCVDPDGDGIGTMAVTDSCAGPSTEVCNVLKGQQELPFYGVSAVILTLGILSGFYISRNRKV
jgi:hypothetical protein